MPETATATRKPPRSISVAPLPATVENLAPNAVVQASRELARAEEAAAEAAAAARAAAEAVDGARAADAGAARDALGAGKAKPPAPTVPKAEERRAEADRAATARREVLRQAQLGYLAALRDSLPALAEAADSALEKSAAAVDEHVAQIEAELLRRVDVAALRRACDPDALVGRSPAFRPVRGKRQAARHPLPRQQAESLEALRRIAGAV